MIAATLLPWLDAASQEDLRRENLRRRRAYSVRLAAGKPHLLENADLAIEFDREPSSTPSGSADHAEEGPDSTFDDAADRSRSREGAALGIRLRPKPHAPVRSVSTARSTGAAASSSRPKIPPPVTDRSPSSAVASTSRTPGEVVVQVWERATAGWSTNAPFRPHLERAAAEHRWSVDSYETYIFVIQVPGQPPFYVPSPGATLSNDNIQKWFAVECREGMRWRLRRAATLQPGTSPVDVQEAPAPFFIIKGRIEEL